MPEDFAAYLTAAAHIRSGVSPYASAPGALTYQYFPALALALLPLTWLPPVWAAGVWLAGSIASAWLTSRRLLHAWPRHARWPAIAIAIAALPFLAGELRVGQANLYMIASCVWAIDAGRRGRTTRAALALTLAVLIKPLALLLLPWLWLTDRRAGALAAGVITLALIALGMALPGATVLDWWARVRIDGAEGAAWPPNLSLAAAFTHALGSVRAAAPWTALSLAALYGFGLWQWRIAAAARRPALVRDGVWWLALVPLVTPEAWFVQMLCAAPLALTVARGWPAFDASRRMTAAGAAAATGICGAFILAGVALAPASHVLTGILIALAGLTARARSDRAAAA